MTKMKFFIWTLLLVWLLLPGILYGQRSIPDHAGRWVHDEAGILNSETVQKLEYALKSERDSTSNQVAILVVSSLEGDEISSYANRVFSEWKLGQEDKDNGVLLVVAVEDRKVRIEVGYGLEGNLTDLLSSRIIRNEIAPQFRRGDYESGVVVGTVSILQAIHGAYTNEDRGEGKKTSVPGLFRILFMIAIVAYLFGRRRGGGGGYWHGRGGYFGPMGGFGGSSGGWSGGGGGGFDFGGGGGSGGGGSSGSW